MRPADTLPPATPIAAASGHAAQPAHGACENCHTHLHGHYCHACGQSAHNPLKHVGHAIEEVFESFWHLDGRIFRTLRDLLVPGRVALNYLKGHRVGYVQPLRLFVILTLFTFFVGRVTIHADDFSVRGGDSSIYASAGTVEDVKAMRAAQLAQIQRQQAESPAGSAAFAVARAAVTAAAAQRIDELRDPQQRTETATPRPATQQDGAFFNYRINGKPWDAQSNPVVLAGWPKFINTWLNRRLENGNANVQRMGSRTDLYIQAILSALPGALFFLMPVFAGVLRVAYVRRSMGYLEHLVVALYSHCWLMLVLLTTFLMMGLSNVAASPLVEAITHWVNVLLWVAVPVYLFWMQRRVYGGNLLLMLLRYLAIGGIYLFLVIFVVMYAVLAGVSA